LDTHKKFIVGCVKDNQGNIVFERKFKNDPHEIDKFFVNVHKDSKIALESSSCWQAVFDYLVDKGYEVKLSNPMKTRLIGESKKKTDWEDARKLADLLRMNMLPLSYAAPHHVRVQRQITRHRLSLTSMRTQTKNKIHAIIRRHGYQFEIDDLFTEKGLQVLASIDLPMCDRFELDQYIGHIRHYTHNINQTQERIEEMSKDDPFARNLCTHAGISYYSSLMITGEIGDIRRFKKAKKLVSYAGLSPSVSQSGEKCYIGPISKQGSKNLRWILIQCANAAIQKDKRLK
jgi:transposase